MIGDRNRYFSKRVIRGSSISGNIISKLNKIRTPLKIAKSVGKAYLLYKDKKSLANVLEYSLDKVDELIHDQYNKKVKSGEIKLEGKGVSGMSFRPDFLPVGEVATMQGNGFKHDLMGHLKPVHEHKHKKNVEFEMDYTEEPKKIHKRRMKKEKGDGLLFPGIPLSQQIGGAVKHKTKTHKKSKGKGFDDTINSIQNLSDSLSSSHLSDLMGGKIKTKSQKMKGSGLKIY